MTVGLGDFNAKSQSWYTKIRILKIDLFTSSVSICQIINSKLFI